MLCSMHTKSGLRWRGPESCYAHEHFCTTWNGISPLGVVQMQPTAKKWTLDESSTGKHGILHQISATCSLHNSTMKVLNLPWNSGDYFPFRCKYSHLYTTTMQAIPQLHGLRETKQKSIQKAMSTLLHCSWDLYDTLEVISPLSIFRWYVRRVCHIHTQTNTA